MGLSLTRQWICVLTFYILCRVAIADSDDTSELQDLAFPQDNVYDSGDYQKRLSSFVRIGRALSSFIRIGKSLPESNLYELVGDGYDGDEDNSALYNYDPSNYEQAAKRANAFVRIGRQPEEPDYGFNEAKRGSAFVRMGKFPSSAFLRKYGRIPKIVPKPPPYYHRTGRIGHSFIRIGKRDTSDALRRMNGDMDGSFGESEDNNLMSRYQRLGKDADEAVDDTLAGTEDKGVDSEKRQSNFVRIGRMSPLEQSIMSPGTYLNITTSISMQQFTFEHLIEQQTSHSCCNNPLA